MFLLDPVVAGEVEAGGVLALQVGVRGPLPPAPEGVGEMAVVDRDRIARLRIFVEAVRNEYPGPEFGGSPPELGEEIALDPDVLHVVRLGRYRQRGDLLVERDVDPGRSSRPQHDRLGGGDQVPRLAVPLLSLTPVGRELDGVAIGAVVGLIPVQKRLNPVLPGRDILQAADRVAEGPAVHQHRISRRPPLDVHPERQLAVRSVHDLEARLGRVILGEHEDQPAVQGLGTPVSAEGHRERGAFRAPAAECGKRRDGNQRPNRCRCVGVPHGVSPSTGFPVCGGLCQQRGASLPSHASDRQYAVSRPTSLWTKSRGVQAAIHPG